MYSIERYNGNYKVDENGVVYGWYGNIMKPKEMSNGYLQVGCYHEGRYHWELVHRLVYEGITGEPIPEGLVINHKDGNRKNNKISNLEVVTHKQNAEHRNNVLNSYKGINAGEKNGAAKMVIDKATGKIYGCLKSAAEDLGINYRTARDYMSGARTNKTQLEYIKQ
jgi:hypothetical protein